MNKRDDYLIPVTGKDGEDDGDVSGDGKKADKPKTIPYERFSEINEQYQEMKSSYEKLSENMAVLEKERKEALEQRLTEQEKYKELADKRAEELAKTQQELDKVKGMSEVLEKVLETQVEEIPEEYRELIPEEYTAQQKLDWIAKNRAKLIKKPAPDLGAGKRGKGDDTGDKKFLSPEEKQFARSFGLTDEQIAELEKKKE